jgi:hypothetical protein
LRLLQRVTTRTLERMRPEIEAEVVLASGADRTASSVASYGFIVSFGGESFSAAVVPNGSSGLRPGEPCRVRLQFLVEEVAPFLKPGVEFVFFEQGRTGRGVLL